MEMKSQRGVGDWLPISTYPTHARNWYNTYFITFHIAKFYHRMIHYFFYELFLLVWFVATELICDVRMYYIRVKLFSYKLLFPLHPLSDWFSAILQQVFSNLYILTPKKNTSFKFQVSRTSDLGCALSASQSLMPCSFAVLASARAFARVVPS